MFCEVVVFYRNAVLNFYLRKWLEAISPQKYSELDRQYTDCALPQSRPAQHDKGPPQFYFLPIWRYREQTLETLDIPSNLIQLNKCVSSYHSFSNSDFDVMGRGFMVEGLQK